MPLPRVHFLRPLAATLCAYRVDSRTGRWRRGHLRVLGGGNDCIGRVRRGGGEQGVVVVRTERGRRHENVEAPWSVGRGSYTRAHALCSPLASYRQQQRFYARPFLFLVVSPSSRFTISR